MEETTATQTPEPVAEVSIPQPEAVASEQAQTTPENITTTELSYIVDKDGKFVEGFEKLLPEDIRSHSAVKKHQTITDLFKAKIGAESLIGKKVADYINSEDPAVVAERNKHFGVPEKAEDYKIDLKIPEGLELGTEGIQKFREVAHKIGLPEKYVNDLAQFEVDLWAQHHASLAEAQKQEIASVEKELREEWKGDAFEANSSKVKLLLTKELGLTDEDLSKPIGNNPALLKALVNKVIPAFGEDKLIEGNMTHSSESAEAQIKTINQQMIKTPTNTPEYRELIDAKKALMARMR